MGSSEFLNCDIFSPVFSQEVIIVSFSCAFMPRAKQNMNCASKFIEKFWLDHFLQLGRQILVV
jgi:hypothetical protein